MKAQRAMEALEVGKPDKGVKPDDVGFIVCSERLDDEHLQAYRRCQIQQVGCGSNQAEEALRAENGDLVKALIRLARPKPRARSVDGGALSLKL